MLTLIVQASADESLLLAQKRSLTCNSWTPEFKSNGDCQSAGVCKGIVGDRLDLSVERLLLGVRVGGPVRNASRM